LGDVTDFQRVEPPKLTAHFLRLCPEFQGKWDEHLTYWRGKQRGEYSDIAEFAHFVVDSYGLRATARFPQIFAEVERLLTQGDAKIKELVSIGLLEDIQTIASNRDFGSEVFVQWLGPTSRQAWYEIAKMWEGKQSLMDVLRDELRKEKGT
jgi:hypothetical protein